MAKNSFGVIGIGDVLKDLEGLNSVPQVAVNGAANAGMRIIYYATKGVTPKASGDLKRGLDYKKERKVKRGKAVYQVTFKSDMNDIFAKTSKDGNRSYYPASQEYGFKTKDGGYVEGRHFMKNTADEKQGQVERKIETEMVKRIDVAIRRLENRKAREGR